jgi:hypothetical protein
MLPEMLKRLWEKPKHLPKMPQVVINSRIILSKCLIKTTRNFARECTSIIWAVKCRRKSVSKSFCSFSSIGSDGKFILCKKIGKSLSSTSDRPLVINKFSPTDNLKLILIRLL